VPLSTIFQLLVYRGGHFIGGEHNKINGENVTFKYSSGLFYLRYFISINGITCTLNFNCNHTGLKVEYKSRPDLTQLSM
jgi:hypothetical protein